MSIESAKAFLKRMNEDEEFKNKILAIEDVESRLACAKVEGFEFTQEDINDLGVEAAVGGGDAWYDKVADWIQNHGLCLTYQTCKRVGDFGTCCDMR